jgi:hypothetical protein
MRGFLFALMLLGCGTTDCPDSVTPGSSCSSAGLSCNYMEAECNCSNGRWVCNGGPPDLSLPVERD